MRVLSIVLVVLASVAMLAQAAPSATPAPAPPQVQVQVTNTAIPANPDDVKSMDAILHAVYDVISGPAGQTRDWNRFRSMFVEGARLIPVVRKPDGSGLSTRVVSPEDYATRAQNAFAKEAFYEKEVSRRVEQWGNIAQVFSTYESRHAPGDQPFARGINSFQLFNDGQRWWIVTIYWQSESKEVPLTPEFLKK